MDREVIRLAVDFTVGGGNQCLRRVGVGTSFGIIEKIIDRSHPVFLEYRTNSDQDDPRVAGHTDRDETVKEEPGRCLNDGTHLGPVKPAEINIW